MRCITFVFVLSTILYSGKASSRPTDKPYGKTIISFAPLQATPNTATGLGLHLERFIGASQKWSLYLPMAYSFGRPDPCDAGTSSKMAYAFPGVKWYPKGSDKKLSYSVGASIGIGAGEGHQTFFGCGNGYTEEQLRNGIYYRQLHAGIVINNGLNLTFGRRYYIGAEVGAGVMHYYQDALYSDADGLMLQGSLKLGYRF